MIEVAVSEIEGVQFYTNIKILEPDEWIAGMGIHRIHNKVVRGESQFMRAIKVLGLRRVGEQPEYKAGIYAQFPLPYIPIKVIQSWLKIYWWVIRFLYDNARIFQQIPPMYPFSWAYFTPYTWYKRIFRK